MKLILYFTLMVSLAYGQNDVFSSEKSLNEIASFSDKWNGKYYFEKNNKDDLKTSFDITIQGLNNITIKYVGDGNAPEIYKNRSAEEVSSDKIKIVFNEKYEEMGEIYLEKYKDSYTISGQVIYFINPGNDSYEIKKTDK